MMEMTAGMHEVWRLPRVLDLAAAEDFLSAMHERVQGGRTLRLDAGDVETLTLPCIQIVLAASASHAVSVVNPSQAFASAFADLALTWPIAEDASGETEPSSPTSTEPAIVEPAGAPDAAAADPQPVVPPPVPEDVAEQASVHQPDPTDESSMAKRILTIDDSKTMRDMLLLTLAEAGFEVLQAVDGQDGLDLLGKERVDVVITDINMPKMDGYDVIRNLRRNPVHKTLPILVLTTESDTDKKAIARDAGATGWMVKPFDPDRLIATIRKVAP